MSETWFGSSRGIEKLALAVRDATLEPQPDGTTVITGGVIDHMSFVPEDWPSTKIINVKETNDG